MQPPGGRLPPFVAMKLAINLSRPLHFLCLCGKIIHRKGRKEKGVVTVDKISNANNHKGFFNPLLLRQQYQIMRLSALRP